MKLAKKYIEFVNEHPDSTWDDFYDYVGIPKKHRSDFASAAILKQAKLIYEN